VLRLDWQGRILCGDPVDRELRLQVAQLKRLVADKTLEVDFFKGALQKVEARRRTISNLAKRRLRPTQGQ